MEKQPLVSIVTPSFNMGGWLVQAIESVLSQDYPRIEYIVMDGGSSDGTLAILQRYEDRLRYVSAPDRGAADAINRGFAMSHGSIVAWLSADDIYLPGAVRSAVDALASAPDAVAVYGRGNWIDERGQVLAPYPTLQPFDPAMLARQCFICQPACLMRRAALDSVGMLDSSLHSAFDYDLWIRLSRRGRFESVPECLADSRMHRGNKSLGQRGLMFREGMLVLQRHYGYVPPEWIWAALQYARDGKDQFSEPSRLSTSVYLMSLPVGSLRNYRHIWQYWKEWGALDLPRKLAGAASRLFSASRAR